MIYTSTRDCVLDLERNGYLARVREEVDPCLDMAEIQRRVYQAQGPAILFEKVKGSPFPAVSNLFGTMDRARFILRSTLEQVMALMQVPANPLGLIKHPWRSAGLAHASWKALPRKVASGPVLQEQTSISLLPQIKSWPDDGGPFVLLPQVYSEDPQRPGIMHSNLGMYRIQLAGNEYQTGREVGLHYQIRRGIGSHHTSAIEAGQDLKVSVFIGGPPAHTLAAIMPLPESMPETAFAGLLAGRRFRYIQRNGFTIAADADFCITGTLSPGLTKPEGPFGDHIGYYAQRHPFPYLRVEEVYCRRDAIWPFTVVGRPPQEDTVFGQLIQEIAGPALSITIPGVESIHAVDAAGLHPLLLAIGRERFVPYAPREPREILTLANAILGFGQTSLAKYLFISAFEDDPGLDIHDVPGFFRHVLERVDWQRDLHFQTRTTIDTLDYSGTGLNQGSKLVVAAAGDIRRELSSRLDFELALPRGYGAPALVMPGILVLAAPPFQDSSRGQESVQELAEFLEHTMLPEGIAMVVLADDSAFTARSLDNFLWVTFTRSNPSHDVYGVMSFTEHKHWGCRGPLIIDARLKPHHAPPLLESSASQKRVDRLAQKGGSLHGII